MSTIKIGWGTRIAVLYGGFVLIIATLVIGSMKQDVSLVSSNYYEQELKYQEVIDAGRNQSALSTPVRLELKGEQILIHFPAEFSGKEVKGTIQFYSPLNEKWDRTISLQRGGTDVAIIKRSALHPTNYTAKLTWTADGMDYYQETKLNLSHQ